MATIINKTVSKVRWNAGITCVGGYSSVGNSQTPYVLIPATTERLGGVIVGHDHQITEGGILTNKAVAFQSTIWDAVISIDATVYKDFKITDVAGTTLINLFNAIDGDVGWIEVIINATGGNAVALGGMFTKRIGIGEMVITANADNIVFWRKVVDDIVYEIVQISTVISSQRGYGMLYNWYAVKGIVQSRFNDWFLGSKDENNAMYLQLRLYDVGNLTADGYPSSSEVSATQFWKQMFTDGSQVAEQKGNGMHVRPIRSFAGAAGAYAIRDTGPAGGLIFAYSGGLYYEAYTTDINVISAIGWSNIVNVAIGDTGTAIGTGRLNTAKIMAQSGHLASEAKLCDDLIT
jgi:hypothetical protein